MTELQCKILLELKDTQVMTNNIKISTFLVLIVLSFGFSQQKQDILANKSSKISSVNTVEKSKKTSIQIETMFGNRKVNFLSIINIPLVNSKKFDYFRRFNDPKKKDGLELKKERFIG